MDQLNKGCLTCEEISGAKTLEGKEGTEENTPHVSLFGEGGLNVQTLEGFILVLCKPPSQL